MVRVDGKLRPFGNRPLTPKDTEAIARALLTPEQWEEMEYRKEMDFAYTIPGVARFRCNLLRQRGSFGLVMRVVAEVIPSFEALGLPREVMEASRPRSGASSWSRGPRVRVRAPPWPPSLTTSTFTTPRTSSPLRTP